MAWSDQARAAALMVRKNKRMQSSIRNRRDRMREFGWKLHSTNLDTNLAFGKRGNILGRKPQALMHFTKKTLGGHGPTRMVSVKIGPSGGKKIISSRNLKGT